MSLGVILEGTRRAWVSSWRALGGPGCHLGGHSAGLGVILEGTRAALGG